MNRDYSHPSKIVIFLQLRSREYYLQHQPRAGPLLRADVLAPFDRADGLHARFWLGKGQVGIGAHQEHATVLSPRLDLEERS
jgi:hypothetical protein